MAFHTLGTVLKKSFSKYNSEIVQFGETGEKEIQPNYQLEADNKKVTLNGNNHEEYGENQFDEDNISIYFSKANILEVVNVAKILEENS